MERNCNRRAHVNIVAYAPLHFVALVRPPETAEAARLYM